MIKLPTILTVAALATLPFSATAHADDTTPVCADGYVAAGPYCVNPIYVNNPMFVDPATCEWGYFQGSCTPEPAPAVDLGEAAYTFQTPDPVVAYASASVHAATPIVAPVVALWLTPAELQLADRRDIY